MLAFNLGVFFRNLQGEEVVLTADDGRSSFRFTGGVHSLEEKTDLTHELTVVLTKGELTCHISIEEESEDSENPIVL